MELHWDKFQLLQVQCQASILTPRTNATCQNWASTTWDLFSLMMVCRGMSLAGESLWQRQIFLNSKKSGSIHRYPDLSSADRRRLDGFQNRCLRGILGIPPAFISRASNIEVLRRASYISATDMLLKRQPLLLGKAWRFPLDHPLHVCKIFLGSLQPTRSACVRRTGRLRREWVTYAGDHNLIL